MSFQELDTSTEEIFKVGRVEKSERRKVRKFGSQGGLKSLLRLSGDVECDIYLQVIGKGGVVEASEERMVVVVEKVAADLYGYFIPA